MVADDKRSDRQRISIRRSVLCEQHIFGILALTVFGWSCSTPSLQQRDSSRPSQERRSPLPTEATFMLPAVDQRSWVKTATLQFEQGLTNEALRTLERIQFSGLDRPTQFQMLVLKARIALSQTNSLEATRQLLMAGRLLDESEAMLALKPMGYGWLNQSVHSIQDVKALEILYQDFSDVPVIDAVLFQLGSQEFTQNHPQESQKWLEMVVQKFPMSSYQLAAKQTLEQIYVTQNTNSRLIGVLISTQGKSAKYGIRTLQGIQLALGIVPNGISSTGFRLQVAEAGETMEQALRALDQLVLKDHVVAVIGPILSKGIEQITKRAQELGVPLLSLARRTGGDSSDFVFHAGLTQQAQAYELVRYATQKLGMQHFAILCPNDKAGIEFGYSFWDSADVLGGKIVGFETYNPGETDFRRSVDKLVGLHYKDARKAEIEALAKEREALHITKLTFRTGQYFQLKPIIDFEAVFIPDDGQTASLIFPTFAYRDVEHMSFLGTSTWKTSELMKRIREGEQNLFFVDAPTSEKKISEFAEAYKAAYIQEPSSFEAVAYDAAMMVRSSLLSLNSHASRLDLQKELQNIQEFKGAMGSVTIKKRIFYRPLPIFTVQNGAFTELLD